uniref:No apical meristem-associated C-terminal domain-containing protein n=1 Tax=Oryza meridionalis TaxID=40149 RepID=A0A0E0EGF9_9ORYZ
MVMNLAHEIFKKENKDKPFTLEYMWREVKDLPKWRRIVQEDSGNKRTKVSSSRAYTSSSNQDTEDQGHKAKYNR